jgi:hypothetical protein
VGGAASVRRLEGPPRIRAWLAGAAYLLWAGAWFWAFSFGHGGQFFRYHIVPRSLALAGAMGVVLLCPPIALRQLQEFRRRTLTWSEALFRCALWTSALWVGFWLLFIVMIKLRMFSGDDAMGVGIDLVLCFGALIAVNAALAVALPLSRR